MSENYGIFKVKDYHSDTGKKVIKVFEKLKQKAEVVNKVNNTVPRLNEHDDEPNFEQLNRDAVKSLIGDNPELAEELETKITEKIKAN